MTMIELLVVIAILGIFMGIAVPGVTKSFQAMSQVKRLTARFPEARESLDTMSQTLRSAFPKAVTDGETFVGKSAAYEAGGIRIPSDELSFPILDSAYAHLRSAQRISYRLSLDRNDDETPAGLIQTRSFIGAESGTGVRKTILERAVGLDLRYLDDRQEPAQWVEEWPPASLDSSSGQDALLPAAVKITVFMFGEVSPQPTSFTTVVNLPAR
jgi:prepilin-type N-terminal cleavage/methylation domain-containing protein